MVENTKNLLSEIEDYAIREKIPIMQPEGIRFLTNYIELHDITNILEIGTAIGYSAIKMALVNPKIKVTTIERDEQRYLEAIKNIKKFGLEKRITLIFNDALNTIIDTKFDLIFIDAAKSQNINFFNHFEKNLDKEGSIITDNIFFHGYTYMDPDKIESKNIKAIARKIRDYVKFLENNKQYKTEIKKIGDGIAVTRRNEVL
ncbi:MAG: O-methyltransferase [Bacilli bacterium]|nr:O-methyltransferase [Bacilli bacterium]